MSDPGNSLDTTTGPTTPDQAARLRRIRSAVKEAAELAVLGVSAGDVEEVMMRHSSIGLSIPELRHAVTLLHNATITLPETPKDTTP